MSQSKMWAGRKRKSLTVSTLQSQHANSIEHNIFSPCAEAGEQSPMTVLSNTLGSITVDTPKRNLFLAGLDSPGMDSPGSATIPTGTTKSLAQCFTSDEDTPGMSSVPIGRTLSQCSSDAGCCMDSPSPVDSAFSVVEQFQEASSRQRQNSLTSLKVPGQAYPPWLNHRNSIVDFLGPRAVTDAALDKENSQVNTSPGYSPWLDHRNSIIDFLGPKALTDTAPDKKNSQKEDASTMTILDHATLPPPSSTKVVKFSSIQPKTILSAATTSPCKSSSPVSSLLRKTRPISAPATLFESRKRAQTTVEDSPITLRHSRLTSSEDSEDIDDGFIEIFDTDSNEAANAEVSAHFKGLMEAPILHEPSPKKQLGSPMKFFSLASPPNEPLRDLDCNTLSNTPGPKCRRGIFKVPSQPVIRRCSTTSSFLKRPDRPRDCPSPVQNKRSRSCSIAEASPSASFLIRPEPVKPSHTRPGLMRSMSESVLESKSEPMNICGELGSPDLLGDNSKPYCLPLCQGKHRNLKSLSPETVCRLINSEFSDEVGEYHIIDCRYPYEYQGGHIKGAVNLYTKEAVTEKFLASPMGPLDKRRIIVFHCEFSSKRGPTLLNHLRSKDRDLNSIAYPALYYPELYLLEGGYKAFFEHNKDRPFCEPQTYKPMDHEEHLQDLRHFKAKSKSWAGERSRLKLHSRKLIK